VLWQHGAWEFVQEKHEKSTLQHLGINEVHSYTDGIPKATFFIQGPKIFLIYSKFFVSELFLYITFRTIF
jgi:hypothetical protein